MNYRIRSIGSKNNLWVIFCLIITASLQGCNLPIIQGIAIAGDYVDEANHGKIKLNPNGTGKAILNQDKQNEPKTYDVQLNFSEFNLKYQLDGDKLIADFYLSEDEWNKYKASPYYDYDLHYLHKSPAQIKAEMVDKKTQTITFYKEADNKLCDIQPSGKKDCLIKQ